MVSCHIVQTPDCVAQWGWEVGPSTGQNQLKDPDPADRQRGRVRHRQTHNARETGQTDAQTDKRN